MQYFKNFQVSNDDGLTVQGEVCPAHLKRVRLINFLEPFIVYGLILAIIWISELDKKTIWMYIILGIILIWMLFISPWWHYEKLNEKEIFLRPEQRNLGFWYFESRGLGSIKKYYQKDENGQRGFIKHWRSIKKAVILWDIMLFAVPYAFEKEFNEVIMDMFGNTSTLTRLGGMLIAIALADIIMIFIAFPVMLRLDNFEESWKEQFPLMILLGIPMIVIFNLFFQIFWEDLLLGVGTKGTFGMKGDDPFTRLDQFNVLDYLGQWVGYVAWGWLQQLLFLSIFSTNFCRAFDLKKDKKAPYIAAFCSAIFFGLIHIPNFWLTILAWIAGFLWALLFMKTRNLMVMGVAHGMLGTFGNKLLPISYNVGPNAI